MSESSQTQTQTQQETGNYVVIVFYKVPKKFHNEIVQINKESFVLFSEHGALKYEVFQLNNVKIREGEGIEAFTNITNLISVSQEEELWVEAHSYRDKEHAKEMMAKCERMKGCSHSISSLSISLFLALKLLWATSAVSIYRRDTHG